MLDGNVGDDAHNGNEQRTQRMGWSTVYVETVLESLPGSNGLVLKAVVGFGLEVRLSARACVSVCVCVSVRIGSRCLGKVGKEKRGANSWSCLHTSSP